jgi:hypothetical protein
MLSHLLKEGRIVTLKKAAQVREQLLTAKQKKLIVQFSRPFEPGTFDGYVIGVGPAFFLLASLNDGFEFDQYALLRLADIRHLECPAEHAEFYKKVRKLRGDKFPARIKIDLTDTLSILDSVNTSLVTLHREQVDPDTCRIGYILSRSNTALVLLEIEPGAKWATEPTYIRINQITRIDLPGPYERALLLAGGDPQIP